MKLYFFIDSRSNLVLVRVQEPSTMPEPTAATVTTEPSEAGVTIASDLKSQIMETFNQVDHNSFIISDSESKDTNVIKIPREGHADSANNEDQSTKGLTSFPPITNVNNKPHVRTSTGGGSESDILPPVTSMILQSFASASSALGGSDVDISMHALMLPGESIVHRNHCKQVHSIVNYYVCFNFQVYFTINILIYQIILM